MSVCFTMLPELLWKWTLKAPDLCLFLSPFFPFQIMQCDLRIKKGCGYNLSSGVICSFIRNRRRWLLEWSQSFMMWMAIVVFYSFLFIKKSIYSVLVLFVKTNRQGLPFLRKTKGFSYPFFNRGWNSFLCMYTFFGESRLLTILRSTLLVPFKEGLIQGHDAEQRVLKGTCVGKRRENNKKTESQALAPRVGFNTKQLVNNSQ